MASHRHTPEIEEQLGYAGNCSVTVSFTPHLVPMNRGILITAYASLKRETTYEEVKAAYDSNRTCRLSPDVCSYVLIIESMENAHNKLLKILKEIYPGELIVSYNSGIMHHKMINLITKINGVSLSFMPSPPI